MKRKIVVGLVVVAIVVIGVLVWREGTKMPAAGVNFNDYKNATYSINGQSITLVNGKSQIPIAPGSASELITQYFGNEAVGDLNGDGASDIAFIVTQDGGGSGTFYYLVAAINTPNGYVGTNAIPLGDRIAPQTTVIKNGEVTVTYAERKPSEPLTAQPSVGVSRTFRVDNNVLTVIK